MTIRIERAGDREVPDRDLQRLLTQAYVEGGFTEPDRGARIFAPPSSPASRFAREGDAEMYLLATAPECRRMGVVLVPAYEARRGVEALGGVHRRLRPGHHAAKTRKRRPLASKADL